jgi:hypothetical protein
VPVADGGRLQVRATLDVNNGAGGHTATFYYRTDTSLDLESNQGWTQLGSPVATGGITSIGANGTQLVLGADSDGIGNHFAGRYHQALVTAGFNPPTGVGADPDFRTTSQLISSPPNYSQWRDSVNNTWTLNGSGWSYTPG